MCQAKANSIYQVVVTSMGVKWGQDDAYTSAPPVISGHRAGTSSVLDGQCGSLAEVTNNISRTGDGSSAYSYFPLEK